VRVAVDIGGTFVDAVELDETSRTVRLHKSSTTPERPADGVMNALGGLRETFDGISAFVHGTTLGLNAILERRGTTTGILANAGFRDVFEIARGDVPPGSMYDFTYRRPAGIVRRRHTAEVAGRLDYRGRVLEPLDEDGVVGAAGALVRAGCRAIAVCFLHSYAHPEPEQRARDLIAAAFPDVAVSISSDVAREYREYERTSTTVLDAYVRPIFERYITVLADDLREGGFDGSFLVTRSGGGAMSADVARRSPLATVLSGPAGGIIGSSRLGRLLDRRNIVSFDVGGTSVDACVIVDGAPTEVHEGRIEGLPLLVPIYDIRTIGAGGGSIAWLDDGLLKVGPQSAGAEPGPIAYGRGGTRPTVTDAALVLGHLHPDEFLGGRLHIDGEAARRGVQEQLAGPLGVDVTRAAASVLDVMVARTVGALRELTVERGMDPRDFSLLAFGGAGPMIAPMLLRELGLSEVIVPHAPAAFSAWGMLMADLEFDLAQTALQLVDEDAMTRLPAMLADLDGRALAVLEEQGVPPERRRLEHRLDVRYLGQENSLPVTLQQGDDLATIQERFHALHNQRYGHRLHTRQQIVTLRVRAVGEVPKPEIVPLEPATGPATEAPAGRRRAYDPATRELADFTVHDRERLRPGHTIAGPAIVREGTCVLVVHGDQQVRVDDYGHLLLTGSDA